MALYPRFLKKFLERQETSGFFLLCATLAALVWANAPWHESYISFWEEHVGLSLGTFTTGLSLRHFVNDILMTFFFLIVGCELKRERLEGELSSPSQIKLPFFAALGGMAVPALLFLGVNLLLPGTGASFLSGWAIPTATDIAFALGFLVVMKAYAPPSIKTFLLALAIIDDLGAVVLICLFYASNLNPAFLAAAGLVMVALWILNRSGVRSLVPYSLLGILLWIAIYHSGIHATLAGVLLALFLPLRTEDGASALLPGTFSPLKLVEERLHGWVAYLILPIFALANAGVMLKGLTFDAVLSPLTLGIIAGLFLGKPIGVMSATWLTVKLGGATLPSGAKWHHVYGMSFLCGIGFTMSLFISLLAFDDPQTLMAARLGVLSASILSAMAGCAILYVFGKRMGG